MTPLEATNRARASVLAAVARGIDSAPDLVAVCEAAGGLCPRKGRAHLAVLVRVGLLIRDGARFVPGRRFAGMVKENLPTTVGSSR